MEQKDESVSSFFDINRNDMNLEVLMSRIHPDDIPFIQKCEEKLIQAIAEVYSNNLMDLKSSYCFRIKNKAGKYILILHQMLPLEVDEKGNLIYCINIHTSIEHITTTNLRTLSLFGFNGMPSFLSIDPYDNSSFIKKETKFTNRETQIIRFIASGMTTKLIAEKLFISEHTVKTHKKNILSKTESKNFTELIARCIKEGLI